MPQQAIPYMQFRGGSSKGVYFLASDLPSDDADRDQVVLSAIGRDAGQIDGLGGANPLTSKVAIVSESSVPDADIDYLFMQVVVGENRVDTTPNCGNILAGVGPFALERGLIAAQGDQTRIRIHMLNSHKICELVIETPNGNISYAGDTSIDGVEGTASPIVCNYQDLAGSACGSLLPTGQINDVVDGVAITCIDNGMPVVLLRAEDLGISGYESADELNGNAKLKAQIESIRLQIGPRMNLVDVEQAAVPKMCLVSAPRNGGLVNTRTFIPHKCHSAIGVLGAVSVATACLLPGSVAQDLCAPNAGELVSVEHPSGAITITIDLDDSADYPVINSAGIMRTARLLSKGELYLAETR